MNSKAWLRAALLCILLALLASACGRKEEEQAQPEPVPEQLLASTLLDLPQGWGLANPQETADSIGLVVDVRQPYEYASGAIPGAVNIPIRGLAQHLDALPGLNGEIILVGDSNREGIAQVALRVLGYTDVRVLAGGMTAWRAAEMPVAGAPFPELPAGTAPEIDEALVAAVDASLQALPDDWGLVKSRDLAVALESSPPFLLDVREPAEFERGRLQNAVNAPLRDLFAHLGELPAKDQPIVVMCASGYRSAMAATALRMAGYQDVRNLESGLGALQTVQAADPALEADVNAFLQALPADDGLIAPADVAQSDAFIVDVREPNEYAGGFIKGAVNIPIRGFADNLTALPAQDEPIIVVCGSGVRSAMGFAALRLLGYQDVHSMTGGMKSWKDAGLPVVAEPVPELTTGPRPAVDEHVLAAVSRYLSEGIPPKWGNVDYETLVKTRDDERLYPSVVLIDVREPDEYAAASIPGTFNLPLRRLISDLATVPFEMPFSD
jgi:rhodanese-related sulfurtransferase